MCDPFVGGLGVNVTQIDSNQLYWALSNTMNFQIRAIHIRRRQFHPGNWVAGRYWLSPHLNLIRSAGLLKILRAPQSPLRTALVALWLV